MTESDLEILRLKAGMEAMRVLIMMLYTGLAGISPNAATIILEKFSALRKEHRKIALQGIDPALSDLVAAEYQEALDDLLSFIESGLKK